MAQLLSHQRETHELLVLVSVAADEMIGVLGKAQHCLELGLAAALEPDARRFPELDNFLDDVPLLIDLDRVHGGVCAGVAVLLDRMRKARVQRFNSRAKNVGEAQQQRQSNTLRFEIVCEVEEIELT